MDRLRDNGSPTTTDPEISRVLAEFEADKAVLDQEVLRLKYLSKKGGSVTQLTRRIRDISPEQRPAFGAQLNELKNRIEAEIAAIGSTTRDEVQRVVDISRQPYPLERGTLHPTALMIREITNIFKGMGFDIVDDREVETVEFCFDRLLTPEWHPVRDTQDTFYLEGSNDVLLRTQTTATQPKILSTRKPPFKILSTGKVYRSDAPDATHSPMFHQIDGFMVDEGISMAHLKGVLETFIRQFIPKIKGLRFRPHYFGYTEPSFELDVQCTMCEGQGCKSCKNQGWIEVLGAGMMHPKLFENAGLDQEKFTGFAFGFGVERLVMQKHGIADIRSLFDNDLNLLRQVKR
ncbi:MAG: phenylalanine--tRNA ligase subunit alpha [Candidatus Gracilibacteria bacterium]